MKILGIDFGLRRIGLAKSEGILAEPLVVVENDEHIFEQIRDIVQNEGIEQLVVGISEGEMADMTREFAQELETFIGLPMDFADETLTSKEVEQKLKERGVKYSTKKPIDHFAAALILEEWLEINPIN